MNECIYANAASLLRSPDRSTHNNDVVRGARRGNTSLATEQTGATEMFEGSSTYTHGRQGEATSQMHVWILSPITSHLIN